MQFLASGIAARVTGLAALGCALGLFAGGMARAADLPVAIVQARAVGRSVTYDGSVEALRQAQLAVQVPGRVLELGVHAGDTVRAGQVLLRIDARAAEQGAAASSAQVAAARAALDVATSELARKRQLAEKKYLSQSALEQAESQYRAAKAQVGALTAQAGAAQTQATLHVLRAPFDGVVAQLGVVQGDMANPGQTLLTLYDPKALRVTAHVPASVLNRGETDVRVWLAGSDTAIEATHMQVLPAVDARTLTQEVRAELPPGTRAVPGEFARLQWRAAGAGAGAARVFVPVSAVVHRTEVTAVYVMGADGRPQLRQVRLGVPQGDEVEVLSGLDPGERLVTDPQAALRALAAER
ncbi:MAG: efflux RND transporter periplasmic adaptor subunit [Burkholderiaceae bacterium]|nr:MAG: efflux RND transporter periplasmic adaptor subunit [Burkholderiaceae bacterium]